MRLPWISRKKYEVAIQEKEILIAVMENLLAEHEKRVTEQENLIIEKEKRVIKLLRATQYAYIYNLPLPDKVHGDSYTAMEPGQEANLVARADERIKGIKTREFYKLRYRLDTPPKWWFKWWFIWWPKGTD